MSTLYLVGEAPGGTGDDPRPALELTGATGRAIVRMAGIGALLYLEGTTRVNLFDTPNAGRDWDERAAYWKARELRETTFEPGDRVIALGNKVAAAFNIQELPYYRWVEWWSVFFARAPHPSGRNRKFNDQRERERFGEFIRAALG